MITKAPQRFNVKPSEAIVCIEKRPVPKVTALGGVATGNIKAKEALIAAGIINNIGSTAAPIAAAPSIGISRVVVARLLVTSVRKVTAKHKANIVRMIGSKARFSNAPPISALKPEFVKAVAILMPDPNKIRTPQGILSAVAQSRSFWASPLVLSISPLGTIKRRIMAVNATIASFV